MSQANSVDITPTASSQDSFNSGLANQQAARAEALQRLRKLRKDASDEIDRLLEFLDASDIDPDLEPSLGSEFYPGSDECEQCADFEPTLGSFDRMADQSKAWRQVQGEHSHMVDAEQDRCDFEDGADCEEEPSGIADIDGLAEQVGGHLRGQIHPLRGGTLRATKILL